MRVEADVVPLPRIAAEQLVRPFAGQGDRDALDAPSARRTRSGSRSHRPTVRRGGRGSRRDPTPPALRPSEARGEPCRGCRRPRRHTEARSPPLRLRSRPRTSRPAPASLRSRSSSGSMSRDRRRGRPPPERRPRAAAAPLDGAARPRGPRLPSSPGSASGLFGGRQYAVRLSPWGPIASTCPGGTGFTPERIVPCGLVYFCQR